MSQDQTQNVLDATNVAAWIYFSYCEEAILNDTYRYIKDSSTKLIKTIISQCFSFNSLIVKKSHMDFDLVCYIACLLQCTAFMNVEFWEVKGLLLLGRLHIPMFLRCAAKIFLERCFFCTFILNHGFFCWTWYKILFEFLNVKLIIIVPCYMSLW